MRRLSATLVPIAVALGLAACGGSGSSSNPNSSNYDPAHTTLKDAGLEVCSESQTQVPQNLASGPGVQNTRAFFVAQDCKGKKTSPDVAMVFQFDSKESVTAGYVAIRKAMKTSSSEIYGPLVVVTTGPNAEANLNAIDQALKAQGAKSG